MANRNYVLDARYVLQQKELDTIADSLGVICFRPDYHAKDDDKNSVLFYIKEEYDKAVAMDKAGYDQLSKDYPRCFWSFENSDINGFFELNCANRGRIQLTKVGWQSKIRLSAELAMIVRKQNIYVAKTGGVLEVGENNDAYNDFNRSIIDAFWKLHGTAFIGSFNYYEKEREELIAKKKSPFTEYIGEPVLNFGADFIIPEKDDVLEEMIRQWNASGGNIKENADSMLDRIKQREGETFIWF